MSVTITVAEFPYSSQSSVNITNTGNLFLDLAYSVPYLAGNVNADLSGILSKKPTGTKVNPSFFNLPYLTSYTDNLINGNYTSSVLKNDNKEQVISYKIPYQTEFGQKLQV